MSEDTILDLDLIELGAASQETEGSPGPDTEEPGNLFE